MSKKKNTLKDLDEFLKQQAAVLVTPTQLGEKIDEPKPVLHPPVRAMQDDAEISPEKILNDLRDLVKQEGSQFRKKFYDIIIKSVEAQGSSRPEDKMLINTALYLKSGDNWKEVIRDYWRNK